MRAPFEKLAELDRMIHEPARLAILTALSACQSADFLFLQRLTGLTKGNLSAHLSKLEDAGLVLIAKAFVGKTPTTHVSLTDEGRRHIGEYWQQLDQVREDARRWQREQGSEATPAETG